MGFVVNTFEGRAGERAGTAFELIDADAGVRAEVWPMCGFNCLRWQVRQPDNRWGDLLYTAPDWETNPVPTRSGHPILFPFPGRLRDGRLTFDGATYRLPLNDSTKRHAIHGFTPRNPWRLLGSTEGESATVTGAFQLSTDLPAAAAQWPADFTLTVTYGLHRDRLRVAAQVQNLGSRELPFGLGYHPYFRLPDVNGLDIGGYTLQANVRQVWEVDEANLPTGTRLDLPPALDFTTPRPIGSTALDHVFTQLVPEPDAPGGLTELAVLSHPDSSGRLRILADESFRELVLFTPPHRHAIAIEPYTCSADAANLAARGIASGWRTVPVGQTWQGAVVYRWDRPTR